MATNKDLERIMREHLARLEANPDEFPTFDTPEALIEDNFRAHTRQVLDGQPGGWRGEIEAIAQAMSVNADLTALNDVDLAQTVIRNIDSTSWEGRQALEQINYIIQAAAPHLADTYESETAPEHATARFHFTGDGITGHSMSVVSLAAFIGGLEEATTSLAKYRRDLRAKSLQETAKAKKPKDNTHKTKVGKAGFGLAISALAPGSVIAQVSTTHPISTNDDQPVLSNTAEHFDDAALRDIVTVLGSDGDTPLLNDMPFNSRKGVFQAVSALSEASIVFDAKVTQRQMPTQRAVANAASLAILRSALGQPRTEPSQSVLLMKIDGWRESDHSVFLKHWDSTDQSKSYTVSKALHQRIRGIFHASMPDDDCYIECHITTTTTTAPGKKTQVTREITSVKEAKPPQKQHEDNQTTITIEEY